MKGSFMRVGVGLTLFMALLYGCASDPFVHNIRSVSDLKADQKVLAGRFACFENDAPVHCKKSEFFIFFNREGDLQARPFDPDDAGYVYIPVTEGYYNVGTFAKGSKGGKGFLFELESFPVILVRSEDFIVNFGTIEIRFYDRPSTTAPTPQAGPERPQIKVTHISNYDVTRSEIASRLGKSLGSISDGSVQFFQRARR